MSAALLPARRFSTAGRSESERVERWETHNGETLIGLRCDVRRPGWTGTELSVQVESLCAARVRATAHSVERDAPMIRRRSTDAVALYFTLSAASTLVRDGSRSTSAPGQFLVLDADRPFRRVFPDGVHELVLSVPRAEFTAATGLADPEGLPIGGFLRHDNVFAHTLARVLGRLTLDPEGQRVGAQELRGLLALTLRPRRGAPAGAYFAAAREVVESGYSDPSFSAQALAARLGLSRRQLSRVFAAHDTSVPRYVLGRRLAHARDLLVRDPDARIADVTHGCGLRSPAYFAQAFHETYGLRPSDLRDGR